MRGAIQSLPSSSPWLVLPFDMNLRNFPKKLDSKTSCLRITVPENLDLALEGLIRKVLREQPKVDDIYGFAADYFDALLKIREKAGIEITAAQICPFHNDEDAHEMIKLANTFPKPARSETPKTDKPKNDAKTRRKEFIQTPAKTEKKTVEKKAAIQKKPSLGMKKKDQKIIATKQERPKTLKLEPKTEDVGEDEEFLKSDPIKALVEKELMDAAKSHPKEKENAESQMEEKDKPEEATANEELSAVVDSGGVSLVEKKMEEKEHQDAVREDEEAKKEEEKIEGETQKASTETVAVAQNEVEDVKKELENVTKNEPETGKTEMLDNNLEMATENEYKHAEGLKKEDKTDTETEEITEPDENRKAVEETLDEKIKNKVEEETESTRKDQTAEEMKIETKNVEDDKVTEETNVNPDELCAVVDILSLKLPEGEERVSKEVNEAKKEGAEPEKETLEVKNEAEVPIEAAKAVIEVQTSVESKILKTELTKEVEEVKIEAAIGTEVDKEVIEVQTLAEPKLEELEPTQEAEEVKTETEEPMEDEKAVTEVEISAETIKKTNDPTKAEKEDKSTISPNEGEISDKQENVLEHKMDAGATEKAIEDLKVPTETEGSDKSHEQMEEKKEETKLAQPEEEDKITQENEATQSEKDIKDEEEINREKVEERAEKSEDEIDTGGSNEAVLNTIKEEDVCLEEKPTEDAEINGQTSPSEKAEATAEGEIKSDENIKPVQNEMPIIAPEETAFGEEIQKPVENETKTEETSDANTEDNNAAPEKGKDQTQEETNNVQEKETGLEHITEKQVQNKEPKEATEILKEVEKTEIKEEQKQENESDEHQIKNPEIAVEAENISEAIAEETIKAEGESEESADVHNTYKTAEDELCTVVDAVAIKVAQPLEEPQPESVQIKTIQTHYYDTLQVPEQLTKKFRVHPVDDTITDNLLNVTTSLLPKREMTETPMTPIDLPKEMDLEDSLLTPLSDYSLNLSELSVQTINEMFLESEKQYSSLDRMERKDVTKPGEKCGDEKREEQQEVEEIIHKTVVPSLIGATPIAPRDDVEINREENAENIKQQPSMDSTADSSNEGRSIDSDTPVISVEVRTVIETQTLDEQDEKKEDDVEIRIETTIDVPEGTVVEVEEKKESKDNDAKDEPSSSEAVRKEKESVQSSGESESSISSTATEIKRTVSKRHFSSTRTLLTTQSLDLDNRTPLLKTRSLSSFRQGVTDFEVWNAIEKELEEAATKIQSNFRGYKTRKKLQRENAVQITTEESSCSTTPVEVEPTEERQQSTGEFHDTIVLSEHPR